MAKKRGWETSEASEKYRRYAGLIPGRQEILDIISRLTAHFTTENPKILDIGCGYGDVTAAILALKPSAAVTLVDFSDDMLELAQDRFKENVNINFIKHDLNQELLAKVMAVEYDAVVSCFALHHIEFENRVGLYGNIRRVLRQGGLFINGDRFIQESPRLDGWALDDFVAWVTGQMKEKMKIDRSFDEFKRNLIESDKKMGDKPGTIWAMREDLHKAGFSYVDCVHMKNKLGLGIMVASETSPK